jgi:lipid II:glycine glycyltransferase (peptidoglycan interpeptide bridge formation enzyme)
MRTSGPRFTVSHVHDRERWNRIAEALDADVRQGFEWGELRRQAGWRPLRIALLDGDEPVAACALATCSVPALGSLMYAARGPLLRASSPDVIGALLAELRRVGRRLRAILLRISPDVRAEDQPQLAPLAGRGFRPIEDHFTTWNTPRLTQPLDLRPSEEELWHGVRRRFREYVRAAPRRAITVAAEDDEQALAGVYDLLVNVAQLKRFPIRGVGYYRALFREYRATGRVTLLVARVDGALAGGLLAIRLGRRSTMLYTSVRSEVGQTVKHHVAPALYWEYIRRARLEGCTVADFGPSGVALEPRATDAGYGVYRFKQGFGCAAVTFAPFHDLVFRPALYRLLRLGERGVLPSLWRLRAQSHHARVRVALALGARA